LKQAHFEILPGFWGYLEHLEKAYIILRTFHAMEYLHWVSWETWGIQGKLEYLEKGLCWENFQDLGYLSGYWDLTIYNMPLMYMLAESWKVPKHWEVLKDRPFSYLETCKILIRISWLVPYKICKILYAVPYWICKVLYKASSLAGTVHYVHPVLDILTLWNVLKSQNGFNNKAFEIAKGVWWYLGWDLTIQSLVLYIYIYIHILVCKPISQAKWSNKQ
jgi:hypothetical protein